MRENFILLHGNTFTFSTVIIIISGDDPCSVVADDHCGEHAECVNRNRDAICVCHIGFYSDGTSPCEDIDECNAEFSW